MAQVADYSGGKPGALALVRAGFVGAVRYIGFPGRPKCTDRNEFEDFSRNGLGMALVFEEAAGNWRNGAAQGRVDGQRARDHANAIGFPADRPIYMAIDQDVATPAEFTAMLEYLRGASASLGGVYVTGVYGEADVIDRARDAGVAKWFWQTKAWSKGRKTPAHLLQLIGTVTVGGIGCDINDVLAPDWGQHNYEGGDVSAQDVVDGLNSFESIGPDGQKRRLPDALAQYGVWIGELLRRQRAMEGALMQTEADVLTAVAGVKGEVLTAVAQIELDQPVSEEQLQRLIAGLRSGLGAELAEEVGRRLLGQTTEGNPA